MILFNSRSCNIYRVFHALFAMLFAAALAGCAAEDAGIKTPETVTHAARQAVNINTASAEELQAIPHVGEAIAGKIIEHRETHGPFRKPEHLMLIDGISDKRFRVMKEFVKVE